MFPSICRLFYPENRIRSENDDVFLELKRSSGHAKCNFDNHPKKFPLKVRRTTLFSVTTWLNSLISVSIDNPSSEKGFSKQKLSMSSSPSESSQAKNAKKAMTNYRSRFSNSISQTDSPKLTTSLFAWRVQPTALCLRKTNRWKNLRFLHSNGMGILCKKR